MKNQNKDEYPGLYRGAEPGQPPRFRYRYLYYLTHIDNIPSILKYGILSHKEVNDKGIEYTPIYNQEIVDMRQSKIIPNGKSLWCYANLYLQPRNPMLYLVKTKYGSENIAIVACYRGPAYEIKDAFITDGNAANFDTSFYSIDEKDKVFTMLKDVDGLDYWKAEDGSKRKMMAEVLIPTIYPKESIHSILVSTQNNKQKVESLLLNSGVTVEKGVIVDPRTFFAPDYEYPLTEYLSLLKGDMFFSGMQTLTVSVNTKGVMGKGLASRAKYQFPDVYIYYQDYCKSKKLGLGHPVIYKREASLDKELADTPSQIDKPNNYTWFLLFATKGDWRNNADIDGIIAGLKWLVNNYEKEGIKSLAIPALGCGLGRLEWKEMGPILCKYLSKLKIPVQLYIPAERHIPDEQLSKSFLLPSE